MERSIGIVQLLQLAAEDRRLVGVGIPAVVFDEGDARSTRGRHHAAGGFHQRRQAAARRGLGQGRLVALAAQLHALLHGHARIGGIAALPPGVEYLVHACALVAQGLGERGGQLRVFAVERFQTLQQDRIDMQRQRRRPGLDIGRAAHDQRHHRSYGEAVDAGHGGNGPIDPTGLRAMRRIGAVLDAILRVEMRTPPVRRRHRCQRHELAAPIQLRRERQLRMQGEVAVELQRRLRAVGRQRQRPAQSGIGGIAVWGQRVQAIEPAAQHQHQQARIGAGGGGADAAPQGQRGGTGTQGAEKAAAIQHDQVLH